MSNDLRWQLASDIHFPYHERRYVDLWFQVMKYIKPDVIDYLGDISDQDCYSRFADGTTAEFIRQHPTPDVDIIVSQEKWAKDFYTETRQKRKNAEIFAALGNHDIRVFGYVDKKLPEHLAAITPEALWDFNNLGIEYIYYGDAPKHRYGDIYVHHGLKISKYAGESVRNDISDLGVSLVRGHSHSMGSYYKTYELRNETLRGWEIGHMTDIKSPGMAYAQFHNWQPGFAVGYIESGSTATKDGFWPHIELIHISPDYTCYVGGKKFSA